MSLTTAIVIGAGVGGLTAAAAIAEHFESVIILEGDALPGVPKHRVGVAQGKHVHGLLAGGQDALEALLPGFGDALRAAGAIPIRAGLDVRVELPGSDPPAPTDFGRVVYSMTRPLLEHVIRELVLRDRRISIRENCRVHEILADENGTRATGVRFEEGRFQSAELAADLIIDASGRGATTLQFLSKHGYDVPIENSIDIDVRYTCATFVLPENRAREWRVLMTRPDTRTNGRRAILFPIEGERRCILGLGGVAGDSAPVDLPGYLAYAKSLRTSTAYDTIVDAVLEGPIVRFAFPKSFRRRFEALPRFPDALLPIADVICRINPSYGQGMSVAAIEAGILRTTLRESLDQRYLLNDLAPKFFAQVSKLLDVAWATAGQDYVYPHLEKDRPIDFAQRSQFLADLGRLATQDPIIQKLMWEVANFIKPPSALGDPKITQRIANARG